MFTDKDLSAIDRGYFKVMQAGCFAVTVQSKNTGHCWHIQLREYPRFTSCSIWHTHHRGTPFHEHGHGRNLTECIRQIQSHDRWQLKKDAEKRRFTNHCAGKHPADIS